MKIKNVKVHQVLGVKDLSADLEGHNLWLIGGKNASGKSSALNAIIMAICGKKGCDYPDQPLKNGEDEEMRLTSESDVISSYFARLGDGRDVDCSYFATQVT